MSFILYKLYYLQHRNNKAMPTKQVTNKKGNIFLRMYPMQRVLLSAAIAFLTFFLIPKHLDKFLIAMIIWVAFAFPFLIISWIILFTREVAAIKKIASKEDGSKPFIIVMVLVASFAGMFTVLLLILSEASDKTPEVFLPVAISGMLLSWVMVHTIFTFHYAHMYYDVPDGNSSKKIKGGLNFPDEDEPDYIDFAYFSFVIGCTFQVSDVEISSRKIRRMALLHGLLSFGLNTFVVALTINLIAGLKK